MVGDRFEAQRVVDPDGYNGLGSGYVYILDTKYTEPVHDEDGMLISFDVEDGDVDQAMRECHQYIDEEYDRLSELADLEYGEE